MQSVGRGQHCKVQRQALQVQILSRITRPRLLRPSIVLVDYPTYVGRAKNLFEVVDAENFKRAEIVSKGKTENLYLKSKSDSKCVNKVAL